MKDTQSKISRPEEPLSEENIQQALVLGTGDLLRTSLNVYTTHVLEELDRIQITAEGESLLKELLDKPHSGFANTDSFTRILLSPLSQDIMYIIWRESAFISEDALSVAGLVRQFQGPSKHLTRNSLKNAICDDRRYVNARKSDALKRSIDRICDALEVYGLIEREHRRDNLKPINGTCRLHNLMSGAHMAVSRIFAQQLQTEDGVRND